MERYRGSPSQPLSCPCSFSCPSLRPGVAFSPLFVVCVSNPSFHQYTSSYRVFWCPPSSLASLPSETRDRPDDSVNILRRIQQLSVKNPVHWQQCITWFVPCFRTIGREHCVSWWVSPHPPRSVGHSDMWAPPSLGFVGVRRPGIRVVGSCAAVGRGWFHHIEMGVVSN